MIRTNTIATNKEAEIWNVLQTNMGTAATRASVKMVGNVSNLERCGSCWCINGDGVWLSKSSWYQPLLWSLLSEPISATISEAADGGEAEAESEPDPDPKTPPLFSVELELELDLLDPIEKHLYPLRNPKILGGPLSCTSRAHGANVHHPTPPPQITESLSPPPDGWGGPAGGN